MAAERDLPPVAGDLREYSQQPFDCLHTWTDDGDVLRIVGPEEDHHIVAHPDDIEEVLFDRDNFKKFGGYEDVFGKGLVSEYGDQWRAQRGTLGPAFQPSQIQQYMRQISQIPREYRDRLSDGEVFDARSMMTDLTMEVMLDALFGGADEYVDAIADATQDITEWFLETATAGDVPEDIQSSFEESMAELSEIIDEMIAQRDGSGRRDDLLSILLTVGPESDADYGRERIRDEMIGMFFGGHETTSLTLTYTLFLLADAPAVVERLRAEFDEVIGDDTPSPEHLDELTYTEQVINESLRVYPPAHTVFRVATTDVEVGEYTIPAGDVIYLPQEVTHHDERWWDDPDTFRPERFGGEDSPPQGVFFPFGFGPRRCIGEPFSRAETKLVVATLVQQFSFERETEEFDRYASLSAVPDRPIRLTARRRD